MSLDADLVAINGSDWSDELSPVWDLLERPAWHRHAKCRGQWELFFPDVESGQSPDTLAAEKLCATCPVRLPCWEQGRHEVAGIWGGVYVSVRVARGQRGFGKTGTRLEVMTVLQRWPDEWMSTLTIAQQCGRDRTGVQRCLKDLANAGVIQRKKGPRGGAGGRLADLWKWNGSEG